MIQHEITSPTPLLDSEGNLREPGYARQMHFKFNREQVVAKPFGLKEWDFYQIGLGKWLLQLVIGHVSYMANYSATLLSLESGERHEFRRLQPFVMRNLPMPLDPNEPHELRMSGRNYLMEFVTEPERRTLRLVSGKKSSPVDIEIILPHIPRDEAMVIATPFDKPGQFYLNCKEHFYGVTGHVRLGGKEVLATGQETALLDWGRGVWPFHQEWFWGCGSGFVNGGRFGFNIGWGFGDLSKASENMFFWEGKAYKLGHLKVERDPKNYMAPWHFVSDDGLFDMTMTPIFDNDTKTKVLFVDNRCHQVFGNFKGWAKLPDGQVIKVENLLAFCEHAVNNW
ncbi:MAG: DUF2804 domain-containing protein [Clostridiales bacterium]|nr:DUF2804 domain-containing protein [Clostridiales bacterium]